MKLDLIDVLGILGFSSLVCAVGCITGVVYSLFEVNTLLTYLMIPLGYGGIALFAIWALRFNLGRTENPG